MPDDLNKEYELIYGDDIYNQLIDCDCFDKNFYNGLLKSLEKQIDFEVYRYAHKSKFDEMFEAITDVIKKVDDEFDIKDIQKILFKNAKDNSLDEQPSKTEISDAVTAIS